MIAAGKRPGHRSLSTTDVARVEQLVHFTTTALSITRLDNDPVGLTGQRALTGGDMKAATCALAWAVLLASPAYSQDKTQRQIDALLRRPPAEIEPLIKVTGDSLDTSITVSSYQATAVTYKGLLASNTVENSFLRAFVDRKTKQVTAQIYHRATYGGRGWKFLTRATYETPDGIEEVKADRVGNDVSCSRYGCSYVEEVVIPIKFEVLEKAASTFDPSDPLKGIHYRIFAQSGDKIDEGIPGNEIAAFVNVVHRAISGS